MRLVCIILAGILVAGPAAAQTKTLKSWSDFTVTDEMTDEVTPAIAGVWDDSPGLMANQLVVGFKCEDNTLAFFAKAEGMELISMGSPTTSARIDKNPVVSNFTTPKDITYLFGDEAEKLASQFIKGTTLRVRVSVSDGNRADWEIPLKGFTNAFRSVLPANCGRPQASK